MLNLCQLHHAPQCPNSFLFLSTLLAMARGNKKGISDETKRHVIHMFHNRKYKQADIVHNLRICLSSVEKILACYRRESEGLHVPTLRIQGCPQALGAADVDVGHLI